MRPFVSSTLPVTQKSRDPSRKPITATTCSTRASWMPVANAAISATERWYACSCTLTYGSITGATPVSKKYARNCWSTYLVVGGSVSRDVVGGKRVGEEWCVSK